MNPMEKKYKTRITDNNVFVLSVFMYFLTEVSIVVHPALSYCFKAPIDTRTYCIDLYMVQIINQSESLFFITFNFIFGAHKFSTEIVGVEVINMHSLIFLLLVQLPTLQGILYNSL